MSQSTNVLPQLEHTTPTKKPISENTQFTTPPQQRNASRPIKASVKAASEQPTVAMLASLGIKVRDFAYESKLPPIQPIYRHPRQIQPAVVRTVLKRQWTESGEDDPFSQSSSQPETSQKKLERTATEPAIPPAPDLTNIDDHEYDSLHTDSQQPEIYPESQQMPPTIFESQESEPYVDTPLGTPKGSLQWQVPDIPTSQLDPESQTMTTFDSPLRFSRISFSQKRCPTPTSSPLASALSLASIDDDLSLSKTINSTPPRPPLEKAVARPQVVDPTHDASAPRVLAMRYHLRKRPVSTSSPFSPTKSPSRLHNLRPRGAVIPPTRSHCASIQSSHSRTRPRGESSSKALLRRVVTNRQGKRSRTS